MKLALHIYKPSQNTSGDQLEGIPIIFETRVNTLPTAIHNQQSFMPLYRLAVKQMHKKAPRLFQNRPVALRPFAVRYSASTEGGVIMKYISLDSLNPFLAYPPPQKLHGEYQVVFMVYYRF
jgi:hypothetical protein